MADLLVSGGIVAALEQAAVAIGRLDAALAGNPLRRAWAFWSELDAARQNRSSRLSPTAPNRARRALVARTVVRPGVPSRPSFPHQRASEAPPGPTEVDRHEEA